ncbi:MAG TPA: hypothetical protein VF395_14110 [Polyangiaceae bacterium]
MAGAGASVPASEVAGSGLRLRPAPNDKGAGSGFDADAFGDVDGAGVGGEAVPGIHVAFRADPPEGGPCRNSAASPGRAVDAPAGSSWLEP